MKNTVFRVVLLSILLQQFSVIGGPYVQRLIFVLKAKTAYTLSKNLFYNSQMQKLPVPESEKRWYTSKTMTADDCHSRSVFIRNKMTTAIEVSCSNSQNDQIGTLTIQPGDYYFFRFYDDYWNSETYSCIASYSATKKLSFDAYKGKAPISFQNSFEMRADGIYRSNGASFELYKGMPIVFLGIGSKLTNGFSLPGSNNYRVIQLDNRKNEDVYLRCYENDGNGNQFTISGTGYNVPKGKVYKLAIEDGTFETGFVECDLGAENPKNFRVYGVDSYGQYKRGSEYYSINENDTVTFETIIYFEIVENEIANTDPNMHLIQIENQMSGETYIHCWGKQNYESPQINVGLNDYSLQRGEVYTFSIPIDDFASGEFWCDVGGIYPNSKSKKMYGFPEAPRGNHFYALRGDNIVYERSYGKFVYHN